MNSVFEGLSRRGAEIIHEYCLSIDVFAEHSKKHFAEAMHNRMKE